ncbi:MAG: hypothetical protein HC862_16905 [Scytonema sp. RU_4_4]|nr:hypothetical protein [Scytonema sp. RU_4_4]NJR73635.1 hypothetical protein [Scytonema sp. CRU_2_7]
MQDELKNVISQAMNSEFSQEPTTQFAEGELSDEALDAVAGGKCTNCSKNKEYVKILWTVYCKYNGNKKV